MNSVAQPSRLPLWRGFNLLEKFTTSRATAYKEQDFAWIAEWGFNFVRLPMSYRCWTSGENYYQLDEAVLREVDDAVALGQRYNLHVNLNFHRVPGYCVNAPAEPLNLWEDAEAQKACAWQWAQFAKRYKGISNEHLSFDLINEPPADISGQTYYRVAERLVEAIRAEDPERLIIADGLAHGNVPVPELVPLNIGQSTRGYTPMPLSHYKASWVSTEDTSQWGEPTWPLHLSDGQTWDKERMRRERIAPWQALERQDVGIHVGEWGALKHTPHEVALAWMRDCLELWREAGWGWALWNFRGDFGVLDSGRQDVAYEDWQGHQLDRQMLELLQAY